jgi:hypothetical protein
LFVEFPLVALPFPPELLELPVVDVWPLLLVTITVLLLLVLPEHEVVDVAVILLPTRETVLLFSKADTVDPATKLIRIKAAEREKPSAKRLFKPFLGLLVLLYPANI